LENTTQVQTIKTNLPSAAGILSIISGSIHISLGFLIIFLGQVTMVNTGFWGIGILWIPLTVIGITSLIGGILALKRKLWGIALTGAILALIWPFSILGVAAIILIVLSRQDFK